MLVVGLLLREPLHISAVDYLLRVPQSFIAVGLSAVGFSFRVWILDV
jgi:hypothetical protein